VEFVSLYVYFGAGPGCSGPYSDIQPPLQRFYTAVQNTLHNRPTYQVVGDFLVKITANITQVHGNYFLTGGGSKS